ncbi:MAG: hypothetical protein AAFP70_08315 [Calditrichota bacterium]
MHFWELDGTVKVIINPSGRTTEDAAVIIRTLSEDECRRYEALVEEGYTELTIFEELFPEYSEELEDNSEEDEPPQTKSTLAAAIREKTGMDLQSLEKMTKSDLLKLQEKLK